MLITNYDIDYRKSQLEIDILVNQLLLNAQEFSRIAGIDGRMFRVITREDICNSFANACTQDHLQKSFVSLQQRTEEYLGYDLTERYHYEEIDWNGQELVQLKRPGIVSLNVVQSIGDSVGPETISPFVQEGQLSYQEGSDYFVDFRSDLAGSPKNMQPRNSLNEYFKIESVARSGDNWKAKVSRVGAEDISLDIQNPRLMIFDLENPECIGTVYPVYPGTSQIIPMAKSPEVIDETTTRYFFRPWMLVDPAFKLDQIDLHQGEFYKLLQEIDFKCFGEAEAESSVLVQHKVSGWQTFSTGDATLRLDIVNSEKSIIYVQYGKACESAIQGAKYPIKLRVYYKTSPDAVSFASPFSDIMTAIAYHAAAEIPLEICDCPDFKNSGFISAAQIEVNEVKMHPITGEMMAIPKNPTENQYGKLVYWGTMKYLKRNYKGVRI